MGNPMYSAGKASFKSASSHKKPSFTIAQLCEGGDFAFNLAAKEPAVEPANEPANETKPVKQAEAIPVGSFSSKSSTTSTGKTSVSSAKKPAFTIAQLCEGGDFAFNLVPELAKEPTKAPAKETEPFKKIEPTPKTTEASVFSSHVTLSSSTAGSKKPHLSSKKPAFSIAQLREGGDFAFNLISKPTKEAEHVAEKSEHAEKKLEHVREKPNYVTEKSEHVNEKTNHVEKKAALTVKANESDINGEAVSESSITSTIPGSAATVSSKKPAFIIAEMCEKGDFLFNLFPYPVKLANKISRDSTKDKNSGRGVPKSTNASNHYSDKTSTSPKKPTPNVPGMNGEVTPPPSEPGATSNTTAINDIGSNDKGHKPSNHSCSKKPSPHMKPALTIAEMCEKGDFGFNLFPVSTTKPTKAASNKIEADGKNGDAGSPSDLAPESTEPAASDKVNEAFNNRKGDPALEVFPDAAEAPSAHDNRAKETSMTDDAVSDSSQSSGGKKPAHKKRSDFTIAEFRIKKKFAWELDQHSAEPATPSALPLRPKSPRRHSGVSLPNTPIVAKEFFPDEQDALVITKEALPVEPEPAVAVKEFIPEPDVPLVTKDFFPEGAEVDDGIPPGYIYNPFSGDNTKKPTVKLPEIMEKKPPMPPICPYLPLPPLGHNHPSIIMEVLLYNESIGAPYNQYVRDILSVWR